MVFSHKLCRWLVPVALVLGTGTVVGLATVDERALPLAAVAGMVGVLAAAGWLWPGDIGAPKMFSVPAYLVIANLAALNGWLNLFRGKGSAAWSPTRRESAGTSDEGRESGG